MKHQRATDRETLSGLGKARDVRATPAQVRFKSVLQT